MKTRAKSISVVVVSRNEGHYLRNTVHSLLPGLPADGEVIVVDDHSTDGSADSLKRGYRRVTVVRPKKRLGVVKARNFGARHAQGEVIVFSDAHVEVPKVWVQPFLDSLALPKVGAVGPVISMMRQRNAKGYGFRFVDAALTCEWGQWQGPNPYPVPLLAGGFMAMQRDVFTAIGGFDEGMIMYGMEDPDIAMRLWTFGYQCLLIPRIEVAHVFRNDHPFQDWETFVHNVLRFAIVHFGVERMRHLFESYVRDESFPAAVARVTSSDAWTRRREIQTSRCYDDDWYFHKFGMD
jgi:GT2 family glycosyltransferase